MKKDRLNFTNRITGEIQDGSRKIKVCKVFFKTLNIFTSND